MNLKDLGLAILEVAYLKGDFTLRSGLKSNYYLDKYLFSTQPHILKAIAEHLPSKLPDLATFQKIAAPELGAVALAAALSLQISKPFVIVRKGAKDYGTSKSIEGIIHAGESVVMIEDILTTAGAAIEAAKKLRDHGITVLKIVGIIDREQGAIENGKKEGFVIDALFTKTSLGI